MRHWRVAEIFGPTIQGEGRQAGMPCYFIRFGGCDLRCSWCDTPHAVLPELVAQLPKMNTAEIIARVDSLERGPEWVVLTGGNPATLLLEEVVVNLKYKGYKVMVETQGTIYRPWLALVDEVCISPKPPSSGNIVSSDQVSKFLENILADQAARAKREERWTWDLPYLKVVVFNDEDYEYARRIHAQFREIPFYISVGNEDPSLPTVGNPTPDVPARSSLTRDWVLDKYGWLVEKVMADRVMRNARVLPQLHTLVWGNERGH